MRYFDKSRPLSGVLLVADIDGTLIGHDGELPERNIEAVNRFISLGGLFSIATGRTADSAALIAGRFEGELAPLIACNGSQIYDANAGRTVWAELLPESAKGIVKDIYLRFPHTCLEITTEEGIYCTSLNDTSKWQLEYEGIGWTVEDIDEVLKHDCYKANFVDDSEHMAPVREYIATLPDFGCELADSGNRYYEVLAKGCNKGTALLRLASSLSVPERDTAVIGDYLNDLEMIDAAGIKAAPLNAADEIKGRAEYICCDCSDGAVAELAEILICKYTGKRGQGL